MSASFMYRAVCCAGKMTAALVQPIPALHQLGLCKAGRRCKVTAHLDNKEMQERSQEQGHTHRETFKTSQRGIEKVWAFYGGCKRSTL